MLLGLGLLPVAAIAAGLNEARFIPEPTRALTRDAAPAPPSRNHPPAAKRAIDNGRRAMPLSSRPLHPDTVAVLIDGYVQDGWESSISVNPGDPSNCVVAYEEGWDFDPDIPLGSLRPGQTSWSTATFPSGTGIYGGYPAQPWSVTGNSNNEFYVSLVRQDLFPTDNTHTIIARSTNSGLTFSKSFEMMRQTKQDRAMFDIDRPASRGGTSGIYDSWTYLCFDDWGESGAGYVNSVIECIASDTVHHEVVLSGTDPVPFRGTQFQPVAGISDGQVFLVSNSISNGGGTISATFHELTGAGSGQELSKSTLSWAAAGQRLGGSTHWGVNGHRIDQRGYLAIDRTFGPRRDFLYFISNRNPNPSDPTLDQGDVWLSVSVNRGTSWTSAKLPLSDYRTQFFPMLDVDNLGNVHVAYYQNEDGFDNQGVLNAGRVCVYYVVSKNGGQSWTAPQMVNEQGHALSMEEPPLQLSGYDYNLIGDYMQLKATNNGAYVGWTGYDQYRADDGVGTKKQRIYVTRVLTLATPGSSGVSLAAIAAAIAVAGALMLRRLRPKANQV